MKDICVCPESDALVNLFLEAPGKKPQSGTKYSRDVRKALLSDPKMNYWDLGYDCLKFLEGGSNNFEVFCRYLDYYREKVKPGAKIILFKAERISALFDKLEQAAAASKNYQLSFISMIRDPRSVSASQLKTKNPYSGKPMTNSVIKSSLAWNHHVSLTRSFIARSSILYQLKYETLVTQMENIKAELSIFLNLDIKNASPDQGALSKILGEQEKNIHKSIQNDPDKVKIGSWKFELSKSQVYQIQRICHSDMDAYAYKQIKTKVNPILDLGIFATRILIFVRSFTKKLIFRISN